MDRAATALCAACIGLFLLAVAIGTGNALLLAPMPAPEMRIASRDAPATVQTGLQRAVADGPLVQTADFSASAAGSARVVVLGR